VVQQRDYLITNDVSMKTASDRFEKKNIKIEMIDVIFDCFDKNSGI